MAYFGETKNDCMKAIKSQLNIIHWTCNIEDLENSTHQDIAINPQPGKGPNGKLVALRIRWTYKAYSGEVMNLNYIAEDTFSIANPYIVSLAQVRAYYAESFKNLNEEFVERTKEHGDFSLPLSISETDLENIYRQTLKFFRT